MRRTLRVQAQPKYVWHAFCPMVSDYIRGIVQQTATEEQLEAISSLQPMENKLYKTKIHLYYVMVMLQCLL